MRTHIESLLKQRRQHVVATLNDINRLRKGSASFSLMLFVIAIGMGFVPLLLIQQFFGLIDALIGAKAIRTMTSEVQTILVWTSVLSVLWLATVIFWRKLSGLAKRLVNHFSFGFALVLAFLLAFNASPLLISFIVFLMLLAELFQSKPLSIALVVLSGFLTLPVLGSLIDASIYNRASISEALSMMVFTALFVVLAGYGLLSKE